MAKPAYIRPSVGYSGGRMNDRRRASSHSRGSHRPRRVGCTPFRPPRKVLSQIVLQGSLKMEFPVDPGFFQKQINRLIVGHYQYGENAARQDYLFKARQALSDYVETGNLEFLVDAANYAMLEAHYPLLEDVYFQSTDKRSYRRL